MASICDKCTHLWRCDTKKYCCKPISLPQGNTCKYSNSKKGCPCFEEGENVGKWMAKSNTFKRKRGK